MHACVRVCACICVHVCVCACVYVSYEHMLMRVHSSYPKCHKIWFGTDLT